MSDGLHLGSLAGGAYQLHRHLQGEGYQRLYLARGPEQSSTYLTCVDKMSRVDVDAFKHAVQYRASGMFELVHVGPLDAGDSGDDEAPIPRWGLVERASRGCWLPDLIGTFNPDAVYEEHSRTLPSFRSDGAVARACQLGRSAGQILHDAYAAGVVLARARPEYMLAEATSEGWLVTGLSARGDALFALTRVDSYTAPLFDRYYYAPETFGRCDDRALVFSLAIMVAEWATGRFPYELKFHDAGPLSGQHLPLALPSGLASLLANGMRLDPASRPRLRAFIDALGESLEQLRL